MTIFPNPHYVFLHDTPSRQLFDREERTFSSGCIRVENPFDLAELLLGEPAKWNQDSMRGVIESGETKTVFLPEPLPVYLLYWTVDLDHKKERLIPSQELSRGQNLDQIAPGYSGI